MIKRMRNNRYFFSSARRLKIFFALGRTPEPVYGGMMEEIGVGGVETAYIELAKYMADLGHSVYLFSFCQDEHIHDGVNYIPYESFQEYCKLNPDVIVSSRWFDAFYFVDCLKILWLQDAFFQDPQKPDTFQIVKGIVCSSFWHRGYIAERFRDSIDAKKIRIIPLSVDRSAFSIPMVKESRKAIYSSNPSRGLDELFSMWKEITEKVPGIHLDICYGWEGLSTWDSSEHWQKWISDQKKKLEGFAKEVGNVHFLGRLRKKELYAVQNTARVCLYPNTFWETFALTGIECQLAGTPMITSDLGALSTTMSHDGNILLPGDPRGEVYCKNFIDATVRLFTDDRLWGAMSNACRGHANFNFPSWEAVALLWQQLFWELM